MMIVKMIPKSTFLCTVYIYLFAFIYCLSIARRSLQCSALKTCTRSVSSRWTRRSPAFTIVAMASSCSDNVMNHAWKKLSKDDKLYATTHLNETDETRENSIAEKTQIDLSSISAARRRKLSTRVNEASRGIMMANASDHDDSVECYARQKLTSADKLYAATYLNETDETRANAIAEIKRWIKEKEDLHARNDTSLSPVGEASRSPTFTNVAMASTCSDSVMPHAPQELTGEDKKYAAAYLNETEETRENVVAEIRRWIEGELRIRIDDFLILRFSRVCKFNLEKTKIRIRNYYKQQSDLPEWYMNRDPFRPELQELLDLGIVLPLRKPDSQGRLVIILRGTRHDPTKHKISDIAKIGMMVTEVAMKYYPAASVYGCASFIDMVNPTIRHILQLRPYILMNMIHTWQSCYPMRYQTINLFNAPAFFDVIVGILKSFMTEKIKNRFNVYSHTPDCFKDIPAEILPIEYGGTDGTIQELTEYWKKLIEENGGWLAHNDENDRIE